MEFRLLWASLWRRRGMASLAALAVAIGASVAAALMHVSGDVGAKLTHELRSLGPNLVIVPSPGARYLPLQIMRLPDPRWHATPVLFSTALTRGHAIPLAGADLAALAQLHPSWRRQGSAAGPQIGASLAKKLGVGVGDELELTGPR